MTSAKRESSGARWACRRQPLRWDLPPASARGGRLLECTSGELISLSRSTILEAHGPQAGECSESEALVSRTSRVPSGLMA